jgi:hypothetical protein
MYSDARMACRVIDYILVSFSVVSVAQEDGREDPPNWRGLSKSAVARRAAADIRLRKLRVFLYFVVEESR